MVVVGLETYLLRKKMVWFIADVIFLQHLSAKKSYRRTKQVFL